VALATRRKENFPAALILAGGLGTRLRSALAAGPKSLASVAGRQGSKALATLAVARVDRKGRLTAFLEKSGRYFCPHDTSEACQCRKPKPGMLLQAAREHKLPLAEC